MILRWVVVIGVKGIKLAKLGKYSDESVPCLRAQ